MPCFAEQTNVSEIVSDLQGTYTRPQSESQGVAIFIPGSGDQEIDGNAPPLVTYSPYRQIADGLAIRGITVFRLKKRPLKDVLAITADTGTSALITLTGDIEKAIATVRLDTNAKCVWLIGHSEGGLFSLIVAHERKDICGIVLAASAARPLAYLYKEQIGKFGFSAADVDQARLVIDKITRGEKLDRQTMNVLLNMLFDDDAVNVFRDTFSIDPAPLIERLDVPILYLRGTNDFQIPRTDLEVMYGLQSKVSVLEYEGLNHIFSYSKGNSAGEAVGSALNPKTRITDAVLEDISRFIKAH